MSVSLAELCKSLYCINRFYEYDSAGPARGRALEDIFADYCFAHAVVPTEVRGTALNGFHTWSGIDHEVDGALRMADFSACLELKAQKHAATKDQIMVFNEKSIDYYLAMSLSPLKRPLYRIFVSDSTLEDNARRLCYMWSIIAVEPDVLPLPTLLEYLSDRTWLSRLQLSQEEVKPELLRNASKPLGSVLAPTSTGTFTISVLSPFEIGKVLETHKHVSDDMLDTIESYDPDHFERHAAKVIAALSPAEWKQIL